MSISGFATPVTDLMQHGDLGVWLGFAVIVILMIMVFWIKMTKLRNKQANHVQARKTDDDARREIALDKGDATVLSQSGQHAKHVPMPGRSSRLGQHRHQPRGGQPPDAGVERSGPLPPIDQAAADPVRGPVEGGGERNDDVRKAKDQDLVRRSSGDRTNDPGHC